MVKITLRGMGAGLRICCVALAVAGCSRGAESLDRREERDPLVKRAQARKAANDCDGAIELYGRALERRPNLARAHLELGLLYDSSKEDYLRAIYHYQRYLDLRPQAEKKELVENLIRQARLAFAASLPQQPSGSVEAIAALKREIAVLRAQLKAAYPEKPVAAPAASAGPGSMRAPLPAPARPAVDTYVVQPGDTLSRIAEKV